MGLSSQFTQGQRLFLGCFERYFSELFHQLRDFQSVFASACAGCFVAFDGLCICILGESVDLSFDLCKEFVHGVSF